MDSNETVEDKDTVDVTINTLVQIAYIIAFPTKALTENNPHKLVRALGQIGLIIPMLPWTFLMLVCAAVLIIIYALSCSAIDWWKDV